MSARAVAICCDLLAWCAIGNKKTENMRWPEILQAASVFFDEETLEAAKARLLARVEPASAGEGEG